MARPPQADPGKGVQGLGPSPLNEQPDLFFIRTISEGAGMCKEPNAVTTRISSRGLRCRVPGGPGCSGVLPSLLELVSAFRDFTRKCVIQPIGPCALARGAAIVALVLGPPAEVKVLIQGGHRPCKLPVRRGCPLPQRSLQA